MQNQNECGIIHGVHRGIAQLVEYWSPKPRVVGSSPSAPAKNRSRKASVFLLSGVFACFSVWNAFFDGFSGGFFMDTIVSSFCFVQSVTIIPSGTSSKKHQSAEKVSRRPQILVFCGHPFSLVYSDAIFESL